MSYRYLLFLLFLSNSIFSQDIDFEKVKMFNELKSEEVDIYTFDKKLKIQSKVLENKFYNEDVGIGYASDRVYESHFTKVGNLSAKVGQVKKNGKYKYSSLSNFELKTNFSSGTMYSDNSYYKIRYPNVKSGTKTQLSYNLEIVDPHFLRRFHFTEYIPSKKVEYKINVDKGVELGWKIYGPEKDKIDLKKVSEGNRITYTWSLNNAEPIVNEEGSSGFLHLSTHIIVFIKSYKVENTVFPVLGDVGDLFSWYQSLISQVKTSKDNELTALTNSITKEAKNDTEKAKKIFAWIQDNIRYVAIEDGWRGFIPYPASEICDKRYGDCKDMTHLMYKMMNIAGIKAEHAWVGTRSLPYKYNETPCLSVDNHLVLSLELNGKVIVLDATDSHTPFGVPSTFILGKEILFKSGDSYKLYSVPEYSPEDCRVINEIKVIGEGNIIKGTANKAIESFEYSSFHNRYANANVNKEEYLEEYLELGQNNCQISNPVIKQQVPRVKTQFTYSYSIPNYITNFGETYYINLNLTTPFKGNVLQKGRVSNFEIDYKKQENTIVTFKIPEGKKINDLPKKLSIKNDFGSAVAEYEIKEGKVIYSRSVSINKLYIAPDEIADWNNFIKELIELYNITIEYK